MGEHEPSSGVAALDSTRTVIEVRRRGKRMRVSEGAREGAMREGSEDGRLHREGGTAGDARP